LSGFPSYKDSVICINVFNLTKLLLLNSVVNHCAISTNFIFFEIINM
jgi:hypothetical protein